MFHSVVQIVRFSSVNSSTWTETNTDRKLICAFIQQCEIMGTAICDAQIGLRVQEKGICTVLKYGHSSTFTGFSLKLDVKGKSKLKPDFKLEVFISTF